MAHHAVDYEEGRGHSGKGPRNGILVHDRHPADAGIVPHKPRLVERNGGLHDRVDVVVLITVGDGGVQQHDQEVGVVPRVDANTDVRVQKGKNGVPVADGYRKNHVNAAVLGDKRSRNYLNRTEGPKETHPPYDLRQPATPVLGQSKIEDVVHSSGGIEMPVSVDDVSELVFGDVLVQVTQSNIDNVCDVFSVDSCGRTNDRILT